MRFFKDIKNYFSYSRYSAKSQLNAEVAGSYLNWLWWVFNPFCMMLIYTFIFGFVFPGKELYFPIYIFIGLTLWDFFNRTVNSSVRMVKRNKAIVTKVYLPKFVLIETNMMVNFIKMMISFAIVAVMMIVFRVPLTWNIFWIVPVFAVLCIFTFGLSCFILHFGVFVEDLDNIIKILLRFMFYATGIFYSISSRIPEPLSKYMLRLNPVACMMDAGRNCLLYGKAPSYKWLLIWLIIGLILSFFGVRKIYKYENSYAKVI